MPSKGFSLNGGGKTLLLCSAGQNQGKYKVGSKMPDTDYKIITL